MGLSQEETSDPKKTQSKSENEIDVVGKNPRAIIIIYCLIPFLFANFS
jgi:hypothetical protein